MWSSCAGAMRNMLAQHRRVSRYCLIRSNLSENHRSRAKHMGMSVQTILQILRLFQFLLQYLFRCIVPIVSAVSFAGKMAEKESAINFRRKSGRDFPTANLDANRQGGLHSTHECRLWRRSDIFASIDYQPYSHSLEAHPITTPPPKCVSDWICLSGIHW